MDASDTLARVELFSQLGEEDLSRLARLAVRRSVSAGETIVRQGEMGIAFYVIAGGEVEVTAEHSSGVERLAVLGPDACFGEMSLFENQVRSATVTALSDTELIVLTRWDFLAELNRPGSRLAMALLGLLARRLRSLDASYHARA